MHCGLDEKCASRFPSSDPVGAVQAVFHSIRTRNAQFCYFPTSNTPITQPELSAQFRNLIAAHDSRILPLILAFIHRFQRCSSEDQDVLAYFWSQITVQPSSSSSDDYLPPGDTLVHAFNVFFSELIIDSGRSVVSNGWPDDEQSISEAEIAEKEALQRQAQRQLAFTDFRVGGPNTLTYISGYNEWNKYTQSPNAFLIEFVQRHPHPYSNRHQRKIYINETIY